MCQDGKCNNDVYGASIVILAVFMDLEWVIHSSYVEGRDLYNMVPFRCLNAGQILTQKAGPIHRTGT